ncbi:RNase adapter RapZ [Fodinisporobacter ferrooxydans]|uniref:RNase adapter RapZ n=1 Tax=Fodinisporobacter ferrooxydans TaxID=2901836 RepID=A0ABY4CLE7_9BACL|nr:RNase adapter RapZ [Alicyclobacillaceae bacterium MYW30-H2]
MTPNLLLITGLSGAGKTVAMQSLEDLGYFCIDNLPPALIPKFGELIVQSQGKIAKVALVCDIRGGDFFTALFEALKEIEEQNGIPYQILFLETNDETLVRRYKETRRRHPLAPEGRVIDGIIQERKLLEEIRGRADIIINTSQLKPQELKNLLNKRFSNLEEQHPSINILSFGFKYGIPIDADLVFDVRFLPNPHYVDSLRPKTGQDHDVYEYVMKWPTTKAFTDKLLDMIDFLLPQFKKEGKSQIVIGIGCTGGKHRSVAIAEMLYAHLHHEDHIQISHRDVNKDR